MRTRHTIDDIAPLLALRERDGLSLAELSRRSGVSAETLRRWELRLSEEGASAFARVEVVGEDASSAPSGALRVTIGSAHLEADSDVDRDLLDAVIAMLLARC